MDRINLLSGYSTVIKFQMLLFAVSCLRVVLHSAFTHEATESWFYVVPRILRCITAAYLCLTSLRSLVSWTPSPQPTTRFAKSLAISVAVFFFALNLAGIFSPNKVYGKGQLFLWLSFQSLQYSLAVHEAAAMLNQCRNHIYVFISLHAFLAFRSLGFGQVTSWSDPTIPSALLSVFALPIIFSRYYWPPAPPSGLKISLIIGLVMFVAWRIASGAPPKLDGSIEVPVYGDLDAQKLKFPYDFCTAARWNTPVLDLMTLAYRSYGNATIFETLLSHSWNLKRSTDRFMWWTYNKSNVVVFRGTLDGADYALDGAHFAFSGVMQFLGPLVVSLIDTAHSFFNDAFLATLPTPVVSTGLLDFERHYFPGKESRYSRE